MRTIPAKTGKGTLGYFEFLLTRPIFVPRGHCIFQSSWNKGISETKSKQQSPCSNCMHQPVTLWGKSCSMCMHWPVWCNMYMHRPVTSQADACMYCMGSKISSLSQIYLYSSYFVHVQTCMVFDNLINTQTRYFWRQDKGPPNILKSQFQEGILTSANYYFTN